MQFYVLIRIKEMSILFGKLLVAFVVINIVDCSRQTIVTTYVPNEAQVALVPCSKLTKYNLYFDLVRQQWSTFRSRCISDGEQQEQKVYDLCKMLYPSLNVLNIVQINEHKQFKIAFNNYSLKPYKCLHGNFQSNALYIPSKCEFQHLVSDTQCEMQSYWQQEATNKCDQLSGMQLNSSFLLKWCDNQIARYTGIEFVCCPSDESFIEVGDVVDDEENDDEDENIDDDESINEISENDVDLKVKQEETPPSEDEDVMALDGDKEEQARYNHEKSSIINEFEKRQIALIEEWKIKKNKTKNAPSAIVDNLNKQYNSRLINLNNEKARSLLENDLNHDDIVQAIINEKKVAFLKQLNEALIKNQPTESLINLINNIFITQERDRLHQVNLYKRLKAYYPDEAQRQLSEIGKHLKYIDLSIENFKNRLKMQNKDLETKIQPLLMDVYERYKYVRQDSKDIVKELDEKLASTTTTTTSTSTSTISEALNEDDYEDDEIDSNEDNLVLDTTTTVSIDLQVPQQASTKSYTYELYEEDDDDDENDDDDEKDEDDESNEEKSMFKTNGHQRDEDEQNISVRRIKNPSSNSSLILIVSICLALLFSMILVAMLVRKRNLLHKEKFMFSKLDTISPEERHVSQMQINGYENPTYKFFEQHA